MKIRLIGYLHGQGGIQTHTHWLATGLVGRGHDVEVISPAPMAGAASDLPTEVKYDISVYERGRGILSTARALSKFCHSRHDVTLVCGTGWLAMLGSLANRRSKRRLFFEGMSGERNGVVDPRDLVKWGFHAIVAQARPVENCFREQFAWHGPSTTIPALPIPLEKACTIPRRETGSPSSGRLKAAYFGRLAEHKRVAWLCEQWEQISPYVESLDIHGTGPDELPIRTFLSQHPEIRDISLRGRYPDGEDYVQLLQQYDVVLLPTTGKEGAPLVLLESMACGVPFVANGVGGIPDYANPDCQITNGNLADFIPHLKALHGQIISGNCSGIRLQSHYHTYFSFDALVSRWEAYFFEILAR